MSPYVNYEEQRAHGRRYYLANREKIKARVKAWQAERPGYGAELKREWRAANPDYARQWYEANRERVIERGRITYRQRLENNPDQVRAVNRESAARRRARLRGAFVEAIDPLLVWERDKGTCGICGEVADSSDWHMDHIVPVARNGEHSYANVQVAHPTCNRRKAAS